MILLPVREGADHVTSPIRGDLALRRWEGRHVVGELGGHAATAPGIAMEYLVKAPLGSLLRSVVLYLKPATGHDALPERLPRWELRSYRDDKVTIEDEQRDGSDSVAAYESMHTIEKSVAVLVERGTVYGVVVFAEDGSHALAGMLSNAVRVDVEKVTVQS